MITGNYTVADVAGCLVACLLFFFVLFVPGYVVAWLTGVLSFRQLSAPWRALVSVPLSIGIIPILSYWIGLMTTRPAMVVVYAIFLVIWIALLAGAAQHERAGRWISDFRAVPKICWLIAVAWLGIAVVSLVDLQIGNRLYFSVSDYDLSMRSAITDAITRTGVRPMNPFFLLGHLVPLRYHYFWFLPCSTVQQMASRYVDSRQSIMGSVVWCGWALIALVPLYFRFFYKYAGRALYHRSLLGIGFFAITGLDLLPVTAYSLARGKIEPDMEWWNEQITSWYGTVIWVPHYVAGLAAVLIAFLIAWHADAPQRTSTRIVVGVLCGLCFATAVGGSVYIAFVFAVFLLLWIVFTWFRGRRAEAAIFILAGIVTIALTAPYLIAMSKAGAGADFVKWTIREFRPAYVVANVLDLPRSAMPWLRLALLPVNYFLELGFFFMVGVVYVWGLRKGPLDRCAWATLLLAGTSVFVATFLRSATLANNDLGYRGFLFAQFVLLLWAAELFTQTQWPRFDGLNKHVWVAMIVLGASGTAYEFFIVRSFNLLTDTNSSVPRRALFTLDRKLGERTYALRQAYFELQRILPENAVLQNSPEQVDRDFFSCLYGHRQTVAINRNCGTELDGDPKLCASVLPSINAVFAKAPGMTPEKVESLCRLLSIDAIVLKDVDGAWPDHDNWASNLKPAISNAYVRVYLFNRSSTQAGLPVSTVKRSGPTVKVHLDR